MPAPAIVTFLMVCGLGSSAAATTYNVGGDGGWTFQTKDSTFYDDQFKNITLYAGDVSPSDSLNFTFAVGEHSVVLVSPEAAAKCDASKPLYSTTGPIKMQTTFPGKMGYICGVPNHCSDFGMHLIVTFVSQKSPSPYPAPSSGGLDGRGGSTMLVPAFLQIFAVLLICNCGLLRLRGTVPTWIS